MRTSQVMCLLLLLPAFLSVRGQETDTLCIRRAVERQLDTYPASRLQDFYKSFYQEHFGSEHLIADTAAARAYLMQELEAYTGPSTLYYEPIGCGESYVRVFLSAVADSLISANQLLDAFIRSANAGEQRKAGDWERKWASVVRAVAESRRPVEGFEADKSLLEEASRQQAAVRHSDAYRQAYHPHYRIVKRRIFEQELQALIDKN
ncbi:MAG: hypothetical protein J5873_00940 [Bacteroidales bacterium]|nr:hypothetical protein [Bacteroidales bacterium]